MWVVSVRTPSARPAHVARTMVRLHAPESLELSDPLPPPVLSPADTG